MAEARSAAEAMLRSELASRRHRLQALAERGAKPSVGALIEQVDAALARLDTGSYGVCQECGDPVEAERLIADPLVRFCLDHLPPGQRTQLERDLELALRVQTALLPPTALAPASWELHYEYMRAGVVGGDHCDVIAGPAGAV